MTFSDRGIFACLPALFGACLASAAIGLARPALGAETSADAKADASEQDSVWSKRNGKLMLQYAPNTIHWNYSTDHAKQSWLVGAEYIWTNRWLVGVSYFNNSFDQKCQLIYGGYSWKLFGTPQSHAYLKVGGGLIIGYRKPYENKIPINSSDGVGLGVIPALGYQFGRFNVQMNVLGTAGLMFTMGVDLFD
jgi:hypothetical protein